MAEDRYIQARIGYMHPTDPAKDNDDTTGERVLHASFSLPDLTSLHYNLVLAVRESERIGRADRTGAFLSTDDCWLCVAKVADVLGEVIAVAGTVVEDQMLVAKQAEADACDNPDCPVHHPSTAGVTIN